MSVTTQPRRKIGKQSNSVSPSLSCSCWQFVLSVLYTRALISVPGLVLLHFWIKNVAVMLDMLFIISFNFAQLLKCFDTGQPLLQAKVLWQ